jgi:hypothetical protein
MRMAKLVCIILVYQLLAISSVRAQQIFAAPVPTEIVAAKKVFVSNGGTDTFGPSERYSGEKDRAYNQFYGAFDKSSRFQLVSTPSEADLVLEVSTQIEVKAQARLRLTVYETKSHYVLWKMDSWIALASRQTTADHNFDLAVTKLASDFEKLAAPPGH